MILIIDNYDSFVYNLYQYFSQLGADCKVIRNDAISIAEIKQRQPAGIVLSPGPGHPRDAGICLDLLQQLGSKIPMLGVCLGHQALACAFGAKVGRAPELMHGKTSLITHQEQGVFADVPSPFCVARYHSLSVQPETIPDCLEITAQTETGIIMGLKHREFPLQGLQFHPESLATDHGLDLIQNFLDQIAVGVNL